MDELIESTRSRSEQGEEVTDQTLDHLAGMSQKREALQAKIEALQVKLKDLILERARQDVEKYHRIVSVGGEAITEAAWKSLAARYPEEVKGLQVGDVETLLVRLEWGWGLVNSIGMEFVLIPAASFMMGSPEGKGDPDEHPCHRVEITKPFYLGIYEVTQAQWRAVMGNNPSRLKGDDLPVENISWNDAQEFIRKLIQKERTDKYRLPTEAEWEYACRAGSETVYCFGNDQGRLGEYAWYRDNSGEQTHPVGRKKPNAWGLYDMHGNVWEWCADWYGRNYYADSPSIDPQGPGSGSGRVRRGGSWGSRAGYCRSANRNWFGPGSRGDDDGLRLARIIP